MTAPGHQWRWSADAISGTCLLCNLHGSWRPAPGGDAALSLLSRGNVVKMYRLSEDAWRLENKPGAVAEKVSDDVWTTVEPPCPGART